MLVSPLLSFTRPSKHRSRVRGAPRWARPELEVLEDRLAPAVMTPGSLFSSQAFFSQSASFSASASASASATSTTAAASASAQVVLAAQQRFVQALYLAELGRAGSAAEVNAWVNALKGPGGRQAVCTGIARSFEACDRLVRGWYVKFLGREASRGEEVGWVKQLQAGQSEEQVQCGILGSKEFHDRAQGMGFDGTPEQKHIQALYHLLLGRTGSLAEVSAWASVLPKIGAQAVALGFLQSRECRTDVICDYYSALLHRQADPIGLNNFVLCGQFLGNIRISIESSAEFFARS